MAHLPARVETRANVLSLDGRAPSPEQPPAAPASAEHPDRVESGQRVTAERILRPAPAATPQLAAPKRNAKTVVLFALDEESRPFLRRAQDRNDIEIRTSGMGRKNAEAAIARILAEGRPRRLITAGLAGALRPDLAIGDIVFDTSDPARAKRLAALGGKRARFASEERIAVTAAEKRRLREQTGADADENESGFVQAICRARGIPCTTIRVISDTANEDMPFDFNELRRPDGNVDYGKVAAALARAPWKLPALIRLWHDTNVATNDLSDYLVRAVPQR